MKINDIELDKSITHFAWDLGHKIYILEDKEDIEKAVKSKYCLITIDCLESVYFNAHDLRFIRNWKLNTIYARQYSLARFTA